MPAPLLPDTVLRDLHDAAISARLDRNDLLATLDRRFTTTLRKSSTPSSQLWQDLTTLNTIDALLDGTVPLRVWLETALDRAGALPEARRFHSALTALGAKLGFPVAPLPVAAPAPASPPLHVSSPASPAPSPVPNTPSDSPTPASPFADVVLITALKQEYDAAREVDSGADGPWTLDTTTFGFDVAFRTYRTATGDPLRVALTWAAHMRTTATTETATRLAEKLSPRCLAMSGVCAGRRGKVEPGDVVIADLVYTHDAGALRIEYGADGTKHERYQADPHPYPLHEPWLRRAQSFPDRFRQLDPKTTPAWLTARPPTLAAQSDWVLACLHENRDPLTHPAFELRCPAWSAVLPRLRALGFVTPRGAPTLTPAGAEHIEELLLLHRRVLPDPPPFRVHVGPIATGHHVMRDPQLFDRLSGSMRTVLAVEMEAAAIAAVAHARQLPWLVMKGVMDHADDDKDDQLKPFAARASAECLLALLRESPPVPRPSPAL